MRQCVDEGILQSYFDGELSGESLKVEFHIWQPAMPVRRPRAK